MPANDTQVGGNHYGLGEYQHWDWVHDVRLPYHPATASKYVDRCRHKGKFAEDLEKAAHYLQKTAELGYHGSFQKDRAAAFWRFVIARNHDLFVAEVLYLIMEGEWLAALEAIKGLLTAEAQDRR